MKKRARLTKRRRKSRRSKTRRRRGGWDNRDPNSRQFGLSPEDVSQYNRRHAQNLQNPGNRLSPAARANQRRRELEQERRQLNNEEGYAGMEIARPLGKKPTLAFFGGKKKKRKRKRKKRKTKKR